MKMNRYFLWILMNLSAVAALAQNRPMTLAEVDSLLEHNNLWLKHSRLEIDAAEGEYAQARRYENPEIQFMHNVQNPLNRKWFDTGYDGETYVQISLPIAIGGQHRNKVLQAEATLLATKAALSATRNDVRYAARTAFIDIYNIQQKLKVYSHEISSVEKIWDAYQEQTEKGNVSQMQALRIAAMLSQLRSEMAVMLIEEKELQKRLGVLLNQRDGLLIEAQLDDEELVSRAKRKLVGLHSSDTTWIERIVRHNAEVLQAEYEEESARQAVGVEKAEALPRITINGEWDKNGSIGHNFLAFGATISVPLWNRNQGGIRTARARHAQASVARELKQNELQTSLQAHYLAAMQHLKLVEEQQQHLGADLEKLLVAAEEQFMKCNITVVEFVDMHSSYRDTKFQMLDSKAELAKETEEINRLIGNSL